MKTAQVTQVKKNENHYKVVFPNLTLGELLALKHALQYHNTSVGADVHSYLKNGLKIIGHWVGNDVVSTGDAARGGV